MQCRAKKGGDNSFTPVRGGSENVTTCKKQDSVGSEMTQLTEQLRLLNSELCSVKTKLNDLTQSISYTNERMDDIMGILATTNEKIKYLEKRDEDVKNLQVTVSQLQNELKIQAQQNMSNEVEIVGIPENLGENLNHTILVAATKLGVDLEDKDFDWVTRVMPTTENRCSTRR
ncbi:unnamed protein product [Parnassius apollo]|uniref:(apollo) hypothetical protein n=1 Tax=Parnassius apollo TaxID=110799 RepID=A0A8S3W482_PARAO|nr:unnamed protein product [Parnassius apollo]